MPLFSNATVLRAGIARYREAWPAVGLRHLIASDRSHWIAISFPRTKNLTAVLEPRYRHLGGW
jgi:hypothetical protein